MGPLERDRDFPSLDLPAPDGSWHCLREAWATGPALIALGHAECPTTRLTLPYVERVFRARQPGSSALCVLQDTAEDAARLASELALTLPVLLDLDPFPLSSAVGLETVPTLVLVGGHGRIEEVSVGFQRRELESLAVRLGVASPLFAPGDAAPASRPG